MNKLTRCGVLAVGAFLIFPVAQLRSEDSASDSLDTAFVDGGRISIELSAGTHTITESPDNHIRVRWSVGASSSSQNVKARTDVDGSNATIEVDGPRKRFSTVIEVPRHSDLVVRLTAGDLDIEKVVGDKDIRLRAGDLSVDVGDARDYAHVEGSLWAGDIGAGPFKVESGGLFRSIEWTGNGEHDLRFHLYAGDVTLYEARQED